jgi:hypothetical protein
MVEGVSRPLRFRSQAFSTSQRFRSKLEFHGLVSCRNRSWASWPLLQSVPLAEVARPSRGHMLPCGHPPACKSAPPAGLSLPVSPTPTRERSCLDPPQAMGPLSASRSPLPGRPGQRAAEPLRSASFTHFEAFLLLRVRSHRPGSPRSGGRCSPGVPPLQRQALRTSEPQTRPSPKARTCTTPEDATHDTATAAVPEGTLEPTAPGETRPRLRVTLAEVSSAGSGPLRDQAAPPLDDVPCSSGLGRAVARPP